MPAGGGIFLTAGFARRLRAYDRAGQCGQQGHVCVPPNFDDTYITNLATLILPGAIYAIQPVKGPDA